MAGFFAYGASLTLLSYLTQASKKSFRQRPIQYLLLSRKSLPPGGSPPSGSARHGAERGKKLRGASPIYGDEPGSWEGEGLRGGNGIPVICSARGPGPAADRTFSASRTHPRYPLEQ